MKKITTMFAVMAIIIGFNGCKKNDSITEKNYTLKLFPKDLATKIAARIQPNIAKQFGGISGNKQSKELFNFADRTVTSTFEIKDEHQVAALYIFNYADGGFFVMSADLRHEPICAYVESGEFNPDDKIPDGLVMWYVKTTSNIQSIREGLVDNTDRANTAWRSFFRGIRDQNGNYPAYIPPIYLTQYVEEPGGGNSTPCEYVTQKGPLLATTWGQGCTYNDNCPFQSCSNMCNSRVPTGCVATAVAQVVRYHHPLNNGYSLNYSTMSNTSGNTEVAKLMERAGNAVSMNYGCGGSSANIWDVPPALSTFGLSSNASYLFFSNNTIVDEADHDRPTILAGIHAAHSFLGIPLPAYSGHCWVSDGYQKYTTDCSGGGYTTLHMNWGWHEIFGGSDFNGWFDINNWNIPGAGQNYQYFQSLIKEIHN